MIRAEDLPPVHLRDHLRILKKRRWTGISFFALVVSFTALYLIFSKPQYQAKAILTLKPPSVSPLTLTGEVLYIEGVDVVTRKLYTQTQFEIFKSRRLAERVMDRLKIWDKFHLGETNKSIFSIGKGRVVSRDMALASFARNIDVISPTALSHHIELRVKNPDPELAARIANSLIDAYVELLYEERSEKIRKNLIWLRDEFQKLDDDVMNAEQALTKFKKQRKTVSVDDRENILLEKLHALSASLTQARIARISAENAYFDAKRLEGNPTVLESVPFILTSNPQIATLHTQYNSLSAEISGLQTRYKEKHPRMAALNTTLAEVKESIRAEVQKALKSLKANYDYTKLQEESIQKELESIQSEVIGMDQERIEYLSLLDSAKVNRAIYDTLLTRLKETTTIQGFHNPLQNIDIIDTAIAPDSPSAYREWYLPLAALVGILLGVFLCYVKDYLDTTLWNERDIYECMKLPVLGIVPDFKRGFLRRKIQSETVGRFLPQSSLMEYFHRIANVLDHIAKEKGLKTFLITSIGPKEGKTTVITNLGVALAQRNKRILLIDADFRRPHLHEVFEMHNESGFSNCAHSDIEPASLIHETEIPNLYLLTSGTYLTDQPITLQSEAIRRAINSLKDSFDMLLFDSSSVQEVSDPCVLGGWLDAILWVVSSGQPTRENGIWAKRSFEYLDRLMIGTVLNRVQFTRGASGYYSQDAVSSTLQP